MSPRADVDYCFRGHHRLRKTDEFSSVFSFRRRIRGDYFELAYRPGKQSGPEASARLGIVVGKRYAARAVDRNRIKRMVRESFRILRRELPQHDVVVRLQKKVESVAATVLKVEVETLFRQLPGL